MNYGELPTTGLYVVLSVVVVWSAILTTQIADVRKRSHEDWKKDARRLKTYATWLLRITKFAAGQVAIVLLFAAWESQQSVPEHKGLVETWWSTAHILAHFIVVVALLVFLVKWFRSMERDPTSPY